MYIINIGYKIWPRNGEMSLPYIFG